MQKKILALGFLLTTVLLVFGCTHLVHAVNEISADPGRIPLHGTVTITLTTEKAAKGTITVTQTNTGFSWSIDIDVPAGSNSWDFPGDWIPTNPTANTDVPGYYDVLADITMSVGKYTWDTEFETVFFVIPELLGPIMAISACFGAVIGFTKFKNRRIGK